MAGRMFSCLSHAYGQCGTVKVLCYSVIPLDGGKGCRPCSCFRAAAGYSSCSLMTN
jgi:hypothetical protein